MNYKVKMKVQTSFYGKNLLPDDITEVDQVTAKRWHEKGIASLRKVDTIKVIGKQIEPKKNVNEFEDEIDKIEEIDEDFEKEDQVDVTIHDICDDNSASNISGDSGRKSTNRHKQASNKSK